MPPRCREQRCYPPARAAYTPLTSAPAQRLEDARDALHGAELLVSRHRHRAATVGARRHELRVARVVARVAPHCAALRLVTEDAQNPAEFFPGPGESELPPSTTLRWSPRVARSKRSVAEHRERDGTAEGLRGARQTPDACGHRGASADLLDVADPERVDFPVTAALNYGDRTGWSRAARGYLPLAPPGRLLAAARAPLGLSTSQLSATRSSPSSKNTVSTLSPQSMVSREPSSAKI